MAKSDTTTSSSKPVPAKKAAPPKGSKNSSSIDAVNKRVAEAVEKRSRSSRPFPACSFEEAAAFAKQLFDFGAGRPVRKITLFDHLGKSPDSGATRQIITNSGKYGLTKGSYAAEMLEITPEGAKAVDQEHPARERAKARIFLGLENIPAFKALFDTYVGNKLPPKAALVDTAKSLGLSDDLAVEAVETFTVNLRELGLLQTLSGAERILTFDHYLDSLPQTSAVQSTRPAPTVGAVPVSEVRVATSLITSDQAQFETTCFYVTPIGAPGSDERLHSDLMLGSIVEPALEGFGLTVVRADQIDKPGTITRQVFDYLLRARLVVVDLSFHNPNVFYELAIRHAARLPVVQIIRAAEKIPFDVNQMRTIPIDTTSIYTLLPQLQSYVAQIASHVRRALQDPDAADNPLSTFYPNFRVQL
ncbi:hypothetical protein [Variovorax sp. EBFNA2]|uniref:hypothetical protein n=1 Tax=Variovorax sp. EBFNA2 TaxID=3342097 RepID=UPI0029BFDC43|nr:hypothetical protein [Variovorax boronicumulans]WPG39630.1 hypothetical protein RZE79_09905 [Variovorax boronicumulans]